MEGLCIIRLAWGGWEEDQNSPTPPCQTFQQMHIDSALTVQGYWVKVKPCKACHLVLCSLHNGSHFARPPRWTAVHLLFEALKRSCGAAAPQICWWACELATHHVVCLLWGLGCRVLCWKQRPGPRGELLVTLTSCSELELLVLSPSPPSLFSRCPPVRTSSSTKLHSRNADNGRLIDFFCRICRCRCSAGCFWHGYWFQIPPAHWRGYRDCNVFARPTQGLTGQRQGLKGRARLRLSKWPTPI